MWWCQKVLSFQEPLSGLSDTLGFAERWGSSLQWACCMCGVLRPRSPFRQVSAALTPTGPSQL